MPPPNPTTAPHPGTATHAGREAPRHGARHVGPHVHGEEAHQLRGAEQPHGHGLAQDGGQVGHGAHPLRQHRADGEGVVLLRDGLGPEQAGAGAAALTVAALPVVVALVEVVVVVAAIVTTSTAYRGGGSEAVPLGLTRCG